MNEFLSSVLPRAPGHPTRLLGNGNGRILDIQYFFVKPDSTIGELKKALEFASTYQNLSRIRLLLNEVKEREIITMEDIGLDSTISFETKDMVGIILANPKGYGNFLITTNKVAA